MICVEQSTILLKSLISGHCMEANETQNILTSKNLGEKTKDYCVSVSQLALIVKSIGEISIFIREYARV